MATYKIKRFSNLEEKLYFLNPATGQAITGLQIKGVQSNSLLNTPSRNALNTLRTLLTMGYNHDSNGKINGVNKNLFNTKLSLNYQLDLNNKTSLTNAKYGFGNTGSEILTPQTPNILGSLPLNKINPVKPGYQSTTKGMLPNDWVTKHPTLNQNISRTNSGGLIKTLKRGVRPL